MNPAQGKPRTQSANIFINYRREDSAGHAGRLFDALNDHFEGRLFIDVDNLDPGTDFIVAIEEAVGSCEALIVVIGQEWLTATDKTGRRRLDDPGDFVRLELESALARKVRVIPVLVQDAVMPRAEELPASIATLARRHAIELSDARWAYDVDRLARTLGNILEEQREEKQVTVPPPPPQLFDPLWGTGLRVWLAALGALVLVAAVVLVSLAWKRADPKAAAGPAVRIAIGASTSSAPAATPASPAPAKPSISRLDNPASASAAATPRRDREIRPVVGKGKSPTTSQAAAGSSKPPIRELPVGTPLPTPAAATTPIAAQSSSSPAERAVAVPQASEQAKIAATITGQVSSKTESSISLSWVLQVTSSATRTADAEIQFLDSDGMLLATTHERGLQLPAGIPTTFRGIAELPIATGAKVARLAAKITTRR